MPQGISTISLPGVRVSDGRNRIIGKHARHRSEVADIAVDDAEQRDDRGLVCGDGIEITHSRFRLFLCVNVNAHAR
jgi:hypothetical protein